MATNLTNFLNGVQTQIANLCQGPKPTQDPAATARAWMCDQISPQPKQMNAWMMAEMNGPAVTTLNLTWKGVGVNGQAYYGQLSSVLTTLISQPLDPKWPQNQQDAWLWFNDQVVRGTVDAEGEAPPDVVAWVELNLPVNVGPTPVRAPQPVGTLG